MIKAPDVATYHPQFAALETARRLCRTLMGGTFSMRKAGQTYLPKHPAESDTVYQTRLNKTFLDNFLDLAITKATGKVFASDPILENVPDAIMGLLDNIDRQGTGLDEFMRAIGKQAFIDGITYVLVDAPGAVAGITKADEKLLGLRPYAIHLEASGVIEILTEVIAGVATVTRLRFKECVSVPDGDWGFNDIEQVRVLKRELDDNGNPFVSWATYRQDKKQNWIEFENGITGMEAIYLVPFYTNRTTYMQGSPGFQNIAESCLEHWQTKSEHAFSLSMCCFGMFTATGVGSDFSFTVGAAKCQISTNPDAKFSVLETSGEGVTLAANALKEIENRIEQIGVQLRVENAGKVTATAAAIDSKETNIGIKAVAESFGDSTETMLNYFADILGIAAPDMSADYKLNVGITPGTPQGLQELTKAVTGSVLSNEGYLVEMKRRGELAEDFDVEVNKEQLAAQNESAVLSVAPITPRDKKKVTTIKKNPDGTMSMVTGEEVAA